MTELPILHAVLSLLVGMVLWGVKGINEKLKIQNGRLVDHIENKDLHYAAQARTEEQIKSLTLMVKAAHQRVDRVEETSR